MNYDHLDIQDALERVDALRAEIEAERPIEPDQLGRAMQRLRLEWTYHSNAIEGNSLTYGETRALLLHGVTAQGKPLKDHLDIRGHREALDYLERFVRSEEALTLAVIRELHKVLLGDEPYEVKAETADGQTVKKTVEPGQFKTLPNHVRTATGEMHYYATPEEAPALMQDLVDWYREGWPQVEAGDVHPIPFAADFHHRFVAIHPFDDGNGRLARLLMNLVLMRSGYVPAVVRQENRGAYYGVLAQADAENIEPFVRFILNELAATMTLYLSALRGEPDPQAFDRRLALLQRQVDTIERNEDQKRSPDLLRQLAIDFVQPLIKIVDGGVIRSLPLFSKFERHGRYDNVGGGSGNIVYNNSNPVDNLIDRFINDEWVEFRVFWTLSGYRLDPKSKVLVSIMGSSGSLSLAVITQVSGLAWSRRGEYGYSIPPSLVEAEELAQEVLSDLMEAIEGIQATVEDKGTSPA